LREKYKELLMTDFEKNVRSSARRVESLV